jgi:hypothetical protein
MKRVLFATACALLLGSAPLVSASPTQGKAKKHGSHEAPKNDEGKGSDTNVAVRVVFTRGDVRILRTHYEPRYRNLPPGLQKKVARGGALPPGWRKKFEPFPREVEHRLEPLPTGYRRGVIDGHAVIFNTRTNVILDVAVLF